MPRDPGDAAQMLQQRIEAMPEVKAVRMGAPYSHAETGEGYVTFKYTHGITEADAIFGIEVEIAEYVRENPGTLYWRTLPETANSGHGHWSAYARLLMTAKPETLRYEPSVAVCPTCGTHRAPFVPLEAPNAQ